MTNEIKLKAYHPDKGIFDVFSINPKYVTAKETNIEKYKENTFKTEDCNILRWTGFRDIYEGYVLDGDQVVYFDNNIGKWMLRYIGSPVMGLAAYLELENKGKITGNIFEI